MSRRRTPRPRQVQIQSLNPSRGRNNNQFYPGWIQAVVSAFTFTVSVDHLLSRRAVSTKQFLTASLCKGLQKLFLFFLLSSTDVWHSETGSFCLLSAGYDQDGVVETYSSGGHGASPRDIDMNQLPSTSDCDEAVLSSPSSIGMKRERKKLNLLDPAHEQDRGWDLSSRGGSDDEDGSGNTRKKLRLSKEQSALLEESFKDHSTLNPVRICPSYILSYVPPDQRLHIHLQWHSTLVFCTLSSTTCEGF